MYIFDSVTKTKRLFEPIIKNKASIYVCGPTVYDDAHLGHAKSALVFDLLRRVLQAESLEVTYVRNVTDVDDKIINKAAELNISIAELSERYLSAYHRDMSALGVSAPDIEPKATESLEAMYEMIDTLIEKNHAYVTAEGDVYFDTSSDDNYLSISARVQNEEDTQSRVESSSSKKNPSDFALWKSVKDDSVSFASPYSNGRPGWHLECSAMIEKHLHVSDEFSVDIHGGGSDLLFPHHENEAAQTRCSTNHELAKYWMHNGFVNIDGEKMSKSLGNSFFIKDALNSYHGEVLRFYLLSTHYRGNFNFSEQDLLASKKRLDKLYRLKKRLFGVNSKNEKTAFQSNLLEAFGDDLNSSKAYALIDDMVSTSNDALDINAKDKVLKRESVANIEYINTLLGVGAQNPYEYFIFGMDEKSKNEIEQLIQERNSAKKAKDFEKSDTIRDKILALGVTLMDTPQGTFFEKVN